MEWVELIVPAGALAEEIAALLAETDATCARGVEVRGEDVVAWAPEGEAEAAARALGDAVGRLRDAGFALDPAALRVAPAAREAEWRDAWKRYFKVARVTRRIVIVPSWETFAPGPEDLVLELDPGRAFGTGAHASTRLCLAELERLRDEDGLPVRRFLDVGTGSGILAIAAARLWPAATGVALDVDPQAVSAAQENLERNGVAARIRTSQEPVGAAAGAFELVVANIQADVLEALRADLGARVAPGGALVLSGLLAEQAGPVAASFARAGADLATARVASLPDDPAWSAVVLRKPR